MNSADKKRLKAQAHALKPVIMIGNAGLTPAVLAEIEIALDSHELIKIRIRAEKTSANKSPFNFARIAVPSLFKKWPDFSCLSAQPQKNLIRLVKINHEK